MKKLLLGVMILNLAACMAPSTPVPEYSSPTSITLSYNAFDSVPTLTSEARDMAIQHCAQYNKYANYLGGSAANQFTAKENHRFACESEKTDDGAVIAGQSQRPGYVVIY